METVTVWCNESSCSHWSVTDPFLMCFQRKWQWQHLFMSQKVFQHFSEADMKLADTVSIFQGLSLSSAVFPLFGMIMAWFYCRSTGLSVHHFATDWNIFITIWWLAMKDPLTFPVVVDTHDFKWYDSAAVFSSGIHVPVRTTCNNLVILWLELILLPG